MSCHPFARSALAGFILLFVNGVLRDIVTDTCFSSVHAEEVKPEAARVTAMEPAALMIGSKEAFKLRGFALKGASAIKFPSAEGVSVEIKESKDASQAKGLENKTVGDTQLDAEVALPAGLNTGAIDYVVVTPAGETTGKIMVVASDAVVEEKEPNNGFREAQSVSTKQYVRASIQAEKDVDVFVFSAQANQRYKATVTSGGPLLADLEINVYGERGQWLAASDDGESRDPVAIFPTKSAGIVYLSVSSVHDLGGQWHSYHLTVEEAK